MQSVIVALDFRDKQETLQFLEQFGDEKLFVKVGMELYYKEGNELVEILLNKGYKIFLDLKLHDIPNTVNQALKNLIKMPVDYITVHASGGSGMLKAASEAVKGSKTKLLAVTVLTSISQEILNEMLDTNIIISDLALRYAKIAEKSGIDGVICSPHEAKLIRESTNKDFRIITPGIRMESDSKDDQVRIATPKQALSNGANELVIGRSITKSKEAYKTYKEILESIK